MINMLRKAIKFSIQRVYFTQSYFVSRHYGKRFNSIGKFKSLTFQLRAIYFNTSAVDMSVNGVVQNRVSGDKSTVLADLCINSGLIIIIAIKKTMSS